MASDERQWPAMTPQEAARWQAVTAFARAHAHDDVRQLALEADRYPDVDLPCALDQIAARRIAATKLPLWADNPNLIFPPRLAMEQCSSQVTAMYKTALVSGDSLVDLTGGFGVDFAFMASRCKRATYVEIQPALCAIVHHNCEVLGLTHARVINDDGTRYLETMEPADTIYIDPARRDKAGNRVFRLADCTPDVTALAPAMLARARRVIIKLSPMLDVSQAVASLPNVAQVHILSVAGECKELLLVLEPGHSGATMVHCVNDGTDFTYEFGASAPSPALWDGTPGAPLYLYEPNVSLMKAGCHALLAERYGVLLAGRDSHLCVSRQRVPDFPGREFVIDAVTTLNKRDLKAALAGITHANVAVRNFPLSAPALAQRLRLRDGGDTYIFGTTVSPTPAAKHDHILLICHKP